MLPDCLRRKFSDVCDLVNDYIYYQTDDMGKEEARTIVDVTCRSGSKKTKQRSS